MFRSELNENNSVGVNFVFWIILWRKRKKKVKNPCVTWSSAAVWEKFTWRQRCRDVTNFLVSSDGIAILVITAHAMKKPREQEEEEMLVDNSDERVDSGISSGMGFTQVMVWPLKGDICWFKIFLDVFVWLQLNVISNYVFSWRANVIFLFKINCIWKVGESYPFSWINRQISVPPIAALSNKNYGSNGPF